MATSTQRSCPNCKSATAPDDRYCGECGRLLPLPAASVLPKTSDAPLAIAAAARVQPEPPWSETPGTLLAQNGTLSFLGREAAETLSIPLERVTAPTMTRIGPLDALQLEANGRKHVFALRAGGDFYEALREMLAIQGGAEPSLRLRALSESFAAQAAQLVRDSFSVADLLHDPDAARGLIRLIGLVTREPDR